MIFQCIYIDFKNSLKGFRKLEYHKNAENFHASNGQNAQKAIHFWNFSGGKSEQLHEKRNLEKKCKKMTIFPSCSILWYVKKRWNSVTGWKTFTHDEWFCEYATKHRKPILRCKPSLVVLCGGSLSESRCMLDYHK